MAKEYLKMADAFDGCVTLSNAYVRAYYSDSNSELRWGARMAGYAAHAINSHDELVAEVERLRVALQQCQIALLIADRFCGNHTADDCGDDVAIPIRDALIAITKNLA